MPKIAIYKETLSPFDGDQYVIDTDRTFGGYKQGDLICHCYPFFDIPLKLELSIRTNGDLSFRSWKWDDKQINNRYLHTFEKPKNFTPTAEQCDTVSGLWSGRIKFEGLKIAVGATVQDICHVNVAREEQLLNKKIYLNFSSVAGNMDKVNHIADKIENAIVNDQINKEENYLKGLER